MASDAVIPLNTGAVIEKVGEKKPTTRQPSPGGFYFQIPWDKMNVLQRQKCCCCNVEVCSIKTHFFSAHHIVFP